MAGVNNRTLIATLVGALVLTAVVLAGAFYLLRQPQSPDQGQGVETSISEEPVAARPDCPSGGVGDIALDCLGGAAGDAPSEGVTVVNVWAWWCGPCRDELPYLQEFADQHPEYTVVGVHADQSAARGARLLNEVGVDLPSYQDDDNTFAGTLGLPRVIPITVVFRDGEMITSFPVPFTSTKSITEAVDEALAEAP